jgi:hypothetical protein
VYGVTRATSTLIGAGVAGFLIWLATQFGDASMGGYWARYGIVAGAGLVLAVSQLLGGWTKWGMPRLAPHVFLFAFVPALIVAGWILLFHEPDKTWFSEHVVSWSGTFGIDGIVSDFGAMLPAIALGLGLVFGLSFDTTGPRRETPPEAVDHRAADEPLTAERADTGERAATSEESRPHAFAGGTVGEPEPEPPPRNHPPE